ncbi:hypothetical protein CP970_24075 [Streptomyces kanamyceticus]|uniref:Uncharacterized protein n=1 Tax=Streptomyces kanamyceticus TaxID=1967 RepID=A0A5J6GI27_STRKN|nr:hypothetical protein CP970_24075 [Streptomyces kanamyceticus]
MVGSAHEGLHRIFQERPEILAPVFRALGIAFPDTPFKIRTEGHPTTSTSSWTSTCGAPRPETNGGKSWDSSATSPDGARSARRRTSKARPRASSKARRRESPRTGPP